MKIRSLLHLPLQFILGVLLLVYSFQAKAQSEELPIPIENARLYISREPDSSGSLMIGGFCDAYLGWYRDTANASGYHSFPTVSPRSGQLGLNMVQAQLKYRGTFARASLALHGGDISSSAWSTDYNYIQEANVGIRLTSKWWLDGGFFKTHIGYESILPKDNFTISLATTTFYEPYYLSGAKLTWMAGNNWSVQANIFNEFNGFVDLNKSPAGGMSFYWEPKTNWVVSLNQIASDESNKFSSNRKFRYYQNLVTYRKLAKTEWVVEGNWGYQENSKLQDSTQFAFMASMLAAGKYKLNRHYAISGRYELYYDPDEILTGAVYNKDHQLVGLVISGFTLCGEYKPTDKSYLRAEIRELITTHSDEDIFFYQGKSSQQRTELHLAMGVWF